MKNSGKKFISTKKDIFRKNRKVFALNCDYCSIESYMKSKETFAFLGSFLTNVHQCWASPSDSYLKDFCVWVFHVFQTHTQKSLCRLLENHTHTQCTHRNPCANMETAFFRRTVKRPYARMEKYSYALTHTGPHNNSHLHALHINSNGRKSSEWRQT